MYVPIENTDLLRRVETLADAVYALVRKWDGSDQDTMGKQLVRAVDSMGANLVDGDGCGSDADSVRFFRYSRSSGREAQWWINRVVARGIEPPHVCARLIEEITECVKMVNGLIRYRTSLKVKEPLASYDDPFDDHNPL